MDLEVDGLVRAAPMIDRHEFAVRQLPRHRHFVRELLETGGVGATMKRCTASSWPCPA
jgi:hypothetical protein